MNKPQRAAELWTEDADTTAHIPQALGDLLVGRVVESEMSRIGAVTKVEPPASSNVVAGTTESATILGQGGTDWAIAPGASTGYLFQTLDPTLSYSGVNDISEIASNLHDLTPASDLFSSSSKNSKSPKARTFTFSPTQEWEGHVVAIKHDRFIANIVDLTARETRSTSTVEIPLKELNASDVDRLQLGMIFRWAIGYFRTATGTRQRHSNIVFRDLPQWTRRELSEAENAASEMAKYFANPADGSDKPS